jgi:hypothetical protein
MTTNDFDRVARSWLDDGPTELSDRVLQSALDEIHLTRQRRASWPARRLPSMPNTFRLAVAIGAVVLAVAGLRLISTGPTSPGGVGTTGPSIAPSSSITPSLAAPSTSPGPAPSAIPFDVSRPASNPGTYVSGDPFPVRVTFTLPAGWLGKMGGAFGVFLEPASLNTVDVTIFQDVYADPCHFDQGLREPLPGPSVDDLAAAFAAMPSITASVPTNVTFAGHRGKQLTITAPASFAGCSPSPGGFRLWMLPLGATYDMSPGEKVRIWILDVNGQRVVISAPETTTQTAAGRLETQAVLDSIRISTR